MTPKSQATSTMRNKAQLARPLSSRSPGGKILPPIKPGRESSKCRRYFERAFLNHRSVGYVINAFKNKDKEGQIHAAAKVLARKL